MDEDNYHSVLNDMRLSNGTLFPIPITLDINEEFLKKINVGQEIILSEKEGFKIATMKIESVWEPDFHKEAELVYGTADQDHPAVNYIFNIYDLYILIIII